MQDVPDAIARLPFTPKDMGNIVLNDLSSHNEDLMNPQDLTPIQMVNIPQSLPAMAPVLGSQPKKKA